VIVIEIILARVGLENIGDKFPLFYKNMWQLKGFIFKWNPSYSATTFLIFLILVVLSFINLRGFPSLQRNIKSASYKNHVEFN